jgi:hypothetical protein
VVLVTEQAVLRVVQAACTEAEAVEAVLQQTQQAVVVGLASLSLTTRQ